ncbi:MAG: SDR family NAD(P)-dependent oxidoreductase [Rhodospirillaceae bacterium]|nr:SDR family NAD(P)-dependent oxidoreductase [Rhodospirillaceae bacterium]
MTSTNKPILLDAAGRVAFVTGATGGIGQAVVRMMLDAGANVAATGRRAVPFDDDRVLPLTLEVTDEAAVSAAIQSCIDHFGRIDYLVHMAGMVGKGRLDELSLEDWNTVVSTNLTSSFLLLKHGYPHLTKPGGVTVLCGSSNGYNGGSYLSGAAYSSSKAALVNLTRYCAKEWAPDGLRVHILSPGPVETPMLDRLSNDQHDGLRSILPLGHYATAEECAGAVLFLCSPHAASMTGTNTNISSGMVLDA